VQSKSSFDVAFSVPMFSPSAKLFLLNCKVTLALGEVNLFLIFLKKDNSIPLFELFSVAQYLGFSIVVLCFLEYEFVVSVTTFASRFLRRPCCL